MRSISGIATALCMVFLPGVAVSQEVADDALENEAVVGQLPYEVIVRPQITRAGLRDLIQEVEEDFYERFNELNIDDFYDIVCYKFLPTMTHIPERRCEPLFLMRSRNLSVSETTMILGATGYGARRSALLLTPRALQKENKPDFGVLQEKMEELTRSDTEFRSIGNALAELKSRLENYGSEQ